MKTKREFYKDLTGCTASITKSRTLYWLKVYTPSGCMLIHFKSYTSYRGAKIALGKIGQSWTMTHTA